MIRKRMLWIAVMVALTVIAGCGGKKAADTTPPPAEPSAPPTETVQDIPAPTPDPVPSNELDFSAINDVYFDFDSYSIKPEYQNLIDAHARFLKANNARRIVVEGHTDERGGREYNLALGQKRSEAVRRALGLLGVPDAQVEAVSFGKEKPASAGSDETAWAQNRRAEIAYR